MKLFPAAILLALVFLIGTAAAVPEQAIRSRIKREPVVSSNVASIGYSRHLRALEIEFVRGAVYRFLDVPRSVYRDLMTTSSKGHFIAENIRGKYRFVRVRERRPSAPSRSQLARD